MRKMSLQEQINSTIKSLVEEHVKKYIALISDKYSIFEGPEELLELFYTLGEDEENTASSKGAKPTALANSTTSAKPAKTSKKMAELGVNLDDLSPQRLQNSSKIELMGLCKVYKHKVSGSKQELIDRLLGTVSTVTSSKKSTKATKITKENKDTDDNEEKLSIVVLEDETDETTETKTSVKKKKFSPPKKPVVLDKFKSAGNKVALRENSFGNLVHPPTDIVFNEKSVAIGKQQDDGTVSDLTEEDIDTCKKYKLPYTIPENLDKTDTNHGGKIAEVSAIDKLVEDQKKPKSESEDEIEEDEDLEEEIDDESGEEIEDE